MRIIVSLQCSQLPIGNWLFDFIKLTENLWADYYEAASLDGATELQMFSKITFPLIWSNIRTTLTLLGAMSFVSS